MFAVGVHGAGPSAPGSNPVETSVIFPGSDAIGLASPAKELGVARATVQYLDAWTQQNAFPQVRFKILTQNEPNCSEFGGDFD